MNPNNIKTYIKTLSKFLIFNQHFYFLEKKSFFLNEKLEDIVKIVFYIIKSKMS